MKKYGKIIGVCLLVATLMFSGCGSETGIGEESINVEESAEVEEGTEEIVVEESTTIETELVLGEKNAGTGEFSSFESIDLEGNIVTEEVLKESELTVINIWGTFCSPCIYEMPYLGELAAEYDSSQVQFVGIVIDVYDESGIASAVEIVEATGANYLHLLPTEDLYTCYLSNVSAVPETLFVDGNGNVLESVLGAREKEEWVTLIDEVYNGLD